MIPPTPIFTARTLLVLALFLTALNALSEVSAPEKRVWTSTDGRRISATYVKSTVQGTVLKLDSGTEVTVRHGTLSKADQEYILERVKETPAAVLADLNRSAAKALGEKVPDHYAFTVKWTKEKVTEAPFNRVEGFIGKTTTWMSKIKVTNHLAQELKDVTLLYSVQIKRDGSTVNLYSFEGDTIKIPTLAQNVVEDLNGKTFQTLDGKVQPGYITTTPGRGNKSDTVIGASIKLMHLGKVVYEWKSSPGVKDKMTEKLEAAGLSK